MWRCKHVSEALFHHRYWDLPPLRRLGLRLHVVLCVFCGRFQRQVMAMQDMARRFRQLEESDQVEEDVKLSNEARERLRQTLHAPPPGA